MLQTRHVWILLLCWLQVNWSEINACTHESVGTSCFCGHPASAGDRWPQRWQPTNKGSLKTTDCFSYIMTCLVRRDSVRWCSFTLVSGSPWQWRSNGSLPSLNRCVPVNCVPFDVHVTRSCWSFSSFFWSMFISFGHFIFQRSNRIVFHWMINPYSSSTSHGSILSNTPSVHLRCWLRWMSWLLKVWSILARRISS